MSASSPIIVVLQWVAQNPHAPYYVMGLIGTVFAVLLAWFLRRLSLSERDVRSLTGYISSGNIHAIATETFASDRRAASTMAVAAGIDENAPIARRFKSYCDGLLLDVSGDDRPRAARSASEVFEPDAIIRETLNLRLLQAIPNVLVGIGLLFTFLGLTAALYFASQGAAAHDVAQTQVSIRNLLDAAAFKFSSSLIALALSIVFLFTERIKLRRYQVHVLLLVTTLDNAFPPLTTEELLRALFGDAHLDRSSAAQTAASVKALTDALDIEQGSPSDQLRAYLQNVGSIATSSREQVDQLETLGDTIARSIAVALDASLGVRITDTFGALDGTIARIGQTMQKANEKVLKRLLDDFAAALERRTKESFDQMVLASAQFSDLVVARMTTVDVTLSTLRDLTEEISTEGRNGLALLLKATASLNELLEHSTTIVKSMTDATVPFTQAASSGTSMLGELGKAQDQTAAAALNLRDASGVIESALKQGVETNKLAAEQCASALNASVNAFRVNLAEVTAKVRDDLQVLNEGIARASETVKVMAEQTLEERHRAIPGFEKSVQQLDAQIRRLDAVVVGSPPAPVAGLGNGVP